MPEVEGREVCFLHKGVGGMPSTQRKRGYVHKTEKEKMKADFPMSKKRQYRISHFYVSVLRVSDLRKDNIGFSR